MSEEQIMLALADLLEARNLVYRAGELFGGWALTGREADITPADKYVDLVDSNINKLYELLRKELLKITVENGSNPVD